MQNHVPMRFGQIAASDRVQSGEDFVTGGEGLGQVQRVITNAIESPRQLRHNLENRVTRSHGTNVFGIRRSSPQRFRATKNSWLSVRFAHSTSDSDQSRRLASRRSLH